MTPCRGVWKAPPAFIFNTPYLTHKARFVARGSQLSHGVDYKGRFAPVVKFATLRMILEVAATENIELCVK